MRSYYVEWWLQYCHAPGYSTVMHLATSCMMCGPAWLTGDFSTAMLLLGIPFGLMYIRPVHLPGYTWVCLNPGLATPGCA